MYFVLAYYHFNEIKDPHAFIKAHKEYLQGKDAKGRIYINEEGVNGQMSIHEDQAEDYIKWLNAFEPLKDMDVKVHLFESHAFAKLTIKYREQLAALDSSVDMAQTGEHVAPNAWKQMLEAKDENTILVDVRNQYEWEVGHFDGALLPKLKTFRDFKEYVDELKKTYDTKKTKVMMYCTGGIRCEMYSCLMKDKGFDSVFQLDGGVIKYGLEEGSKHWKGKLFVFDDRMAVPISEETTEVIAHCHDCGCPCEVYYNCANMDCNKLFISCEDCAKKLMGCCSAKCTHEPRVRTFTPSKHPKPFRKLPFEEKSELNSKGA
ncbi:MAG: hypothetical protein S4CHLAM37_13730 [Chlamydiia bacterium]|nr:hypothetical protein [Chlamydiia bacterium]